MRRVLKEPLFHFLVLGAVLFGLYGLVAKKEAEPAKIVVSAARIENLAMGFARTRQRLPSAEELSGLVEDFIRDEVFYREGKAAGLDRDDTVIRRRLRQKMEFTLEDTGAAEPSDAQLSAYLAANAAQFRRENRLTFSHIYLSAARGETLERDARAVAAKLASISKEADVTSLGDRFLLGDEFRDLSQSDVARTFGEKFAAQVSELERERWRGPVPSSYGLHFVRISEHVEGGVPPLDSVRTAVRREWMNTRRLEAEADLYRTLRARYEIVVETPQAGATDKKAAEAAR